MHFAQGSSRMLLYFTMPKLSNLENGRGKIFITLSGSKDIISMSGLHYDYQANFCI